MSIVARAPVSLGIPSLPGNAGRFVIPDGAMINPSLSTRNLGPLPVAGGGPEGLRKSADDLSFGPFWPTGSRYPGISLVSRLILTLSRSAKRSCKHHCYVIFSRARRELGSNIEVGALHPIRRMKLEKLDAVSHKDKVLKALLKV